MTIGEKIKQRRLEMKWSQRELCRRMEYKDHSTIAKIEAGKVDIPQSRIVQFAEVLGVSVAYLMNWEEVQKKNDTLSDIVLRLRTADNDLLDLIDSISKLDRDKLNAVKTMVSVLLK